MYIEAHNLRRVYEEENCEEKDSIDEHHLRTETSSLGYCSLSLHNVVGIRGSNAAWATVVHTYWTAEGGHGAGGCILSTRKKLN